ncbi:hypothetical protein [Nitrosomonas eutropha]|nr:hypothetical protein [Nitrosomonas eutropha]
MSRTRVQQHFIYPMGLLSGCSLTDSQGMPFPLLHLSEGSQSAA